jgi:hypothetical protein
MTQATLEALNGLRDLSMLKWYVIPLLAIVFYIYTFEMKKAKETGNWNAIFAGLTIFGMDFINETWNGWVLHFTERSAFWTTPGDTALRTMVGWNIEIMFMFAISGIVYYNTISENREERILGIPNWWFWAIGYSAFAVFVECVLNYGGHLVWEYSFWNRSFAGVWLIFFFGYLHFYVAALLVIGMKSYKNKIITVSIIYALPIVANILGLGVFGWVY